MTLARAPYDCAKGPSGRKTPALHPVLVADLADDGERDYLEGVALAGGSVIVPLAASPIDGSLHVLEIHTRTREPLVVFAEPLGERTKEGFPLRLRTITPAP